MNYLKKLGLSGILAVGLLTIAGASTAPATTLEVGGSAKNEPIEVKTSATFETSIVIKDEFGTTADSCFFSELSFSTFGPYSGAAVSGPALLWLGGCSHTTGVIKSGNISVTYNGLNTTKGTVSSSGAEFTVQSTFFGASAICKTGSGTALGTLTGVQTGHALIDVNATINCGILGSSKMTGTYKVTSPTGLGVVN